MTAQLSLPDNTPWVCYTLRCTHTDAANEFSESLRNDFAHIITGTSITTAPEDRPEFAVTTFNETVYIIAHISELDSSTEYSPYNLLEETAEHWRYAHVAFPQPDTYSGNMAVFTTDRFTGAINYVAYYKGNSTYYGWDAQHAASAHTGDEAPFLIPSDGPTPPTWPGYNLGFEQHPSHQDFVTVANQLENHAPTDN